MTLGPTTPDDAIKGLDAARYALEEDVLSRAQKKVGQNNIEMRKSIEQDLRDFLATGKKVQVIPMGVSGQDKMGRSKNIVISRKRRTAIRTS